MKYGKLAKEIWQHDSEINHTLQSQGWLVLRYWEHEIKANTEGVVDEIEDCLMNATLSLRLP
jgi:very-short-patch-repair endonuclease